MLQLSRKLNEKAECLLCPHLCKLGPGKAGICGARQNTGDKVELLTYGSVSGYSPDPIEKKPFYHWFPGYYILSVGSYGCNMRCDFCQNYHISQSIPGSGNKQMTPSEIAGDALKTKRNIGVAFTYNEPVISFEFMRDTAVEAKKRGLYTAMVSNGYVNDGPLNEIIKFIDAFNIDLKAFNNEFYRKLTGASIEPVKNCLRKIVEAGKHLEITTLIIPGLNDSETEMEKEAEWIAKELGINIPLHLSRYFPMYKRNDIATPENTLKGLGRIASEKLEFVYLGNLNTDEGQTTICSGCSSTITIRSGYDIKLLNVDADGNCKKCGKLIYKNLIPS